MSADKTVLKVSEIKPNPQNPRIIRDDKFKKLVQSLKDFPIMAKKLRKVVVDENNVILGGNMRFNAIKEAGMKEVHVEYFTREDAEENNRLAKELDPGYVDKTYEEQCREFIIKDNVSGGEWDWDILANEWDAEELDAWGLDLPDDWYEDETKEDNPYTGKVEAPIYEITGKDVALKDLYNPEKTIALIEQISDANIPEPVKQFLSTAAYRFVEFNYSNIAEYYATQPKEVQDIMEDLALVIIDYDKSIEKGFIKLSEEIAKQYVTDNN